MTDASGSLQKIYLLYRLFNSVVPNCYKTSSVNLKLVFTYSINNNGCQGILLVFMSVNQTCFHATTTWVDKSYFQPLTSSLLQSMLLLFIILTCKIEVLVISFFSLSVCLLARCRSLFFFCKFISTVGRTDLKIVKIQKIPIRFGTVRVWLIWYYYST